MHFCRQLRERTGLSKYGMAKALGMHWSNYDRTEKIGTRLRYDHLDRAMILGRKHGITYEEMFAWIKTDAESIEDSKCRPKAKSKAPTQLRSENHDIDT